MNPVNCFGNVTTLRVQMLLSNAVDGELTELELMELTRFKHKTIHKAVKSLAGEGVVTVEPSVKRCYLKVKLVPVVSREPCLARVPAKTKKRSQRIEGGDTID